VSAVVPRVGRIEFVNCFPLYLHFEEELARRGYGARIVSGVPTRLNEELVDGGVDVALPSSIEFARHCDRLELVDGLAIGATGAVDSVQLFTKVPTDRLRSIAVSEKSATSVTLLRILCRAWGIEPALQARVEPLADTLAAFDGLLLIGDEALHLLRAGVYPHHLDLGEAWNRLTGLPMVFAVCAARRDFALSDAEALEAVRASLIASRERCAAEPGATAAAGALVYDFRQAYLERYFDRLSYQLGVDERRGLDEFYRRAVDVGDLDAAPPPLAPADD